MRYLRFFILACLLGLGIISPGSTRADAADAWWDNAWPYRIPVTVSGSGIAQVSINFTTAFNDELLSLSVDSGLNGLTSDTDFGNSI